MIEIGALAASIVGSFLVPLLKDGATKLTETLSEQMATASAEGLVGVAQRLWQRIRGKAADTPDKDVVDLFESRPEMMRDPVEQIVRQMLEQDESFRREATGLLEAPADGSSTRWQVMAKYANIVDARNAQISGGVVAGAYFGAPPESGPTAAEAPGEGSGQA